MDIIKDYPDGSDITVINTTYIYPKKNEDGTWEKDKMIVLYRDNVLGKKFVEEIEEPKYVFFKSKDDVFIDHHLFFTDLSNVTPIEVPYSSLLKEIATQTGYEEFFYDNIKNRDRRANEQLHTVNSIFNSDMHIEDAWRFYFDLKYQNNPFNPTKAYFDIEIDPINQRGDFPTPGECPINAITYISTQTNEVSTFLLRDPNNPLVQEFEDSIDANLFAELKTFIINHVGGPKYAKKHKIIDFEYSFFFYDEEINLGSDLFKVINFYEPDFLLAWNASFDLPYIIERIKILGYKPEDIMCHPDVKTKYVKYYIDERNKQMPAQRGDYYVVNGKTVYDDQLRHFASRRKGQSAFDNFKLDNIGNIIAKVGKLDWSHIARTFAEFPRKNYKLFVFYNIMDTIVQHCVENAVGDIDYIFNKCLMNNTRYHKGHRQTIYLTNRGIKEFYGEGYVMGNNINRNNEKPPKFPGALIGDPVNNSAYAKLHISGNPINIANNLDDFDYKSLYPSIMREFNIAPNTQIGRIIINKVVHEGENPFKYDKFARGGQFIEDFHSGNYIEFCNRWFHLGTYKDVLHDAEEYLATHKTHGYMNPDCAKDLVRFTDLNIQRNLVDFHNGPRGQQLINYTPERDFTDVLTYVKEHAQMDVDSIELAMRRKEREKEEDEELARLFGYDELNNNFAMQSSESEE